MTIAMAGSSVGMALDDRGFIRTEFRPVRSTHHPIAAVANPNATCVSNKQNRAKNEPLSTVQPCCERALAMGTAATIAMQMTMQVRKRRRRKAMTPIAFEVNAMLLNELPHQE
jgi:hypothetical protein